MVFTDSSSNMDEHNLKVFIICTHSVTGALPLGLIITSDEKTTTLASAFTMYKQNLPDDAFYKRDMEGPISFMTDNCSELRDALHIVWPSNLLLCRFHILQQVWRWLCEKNNNVEPADRNNIMLSFKDLAYESNIDAFDEKYAILTEENEIIQKYPKLLEYIDGVQHISKSWSTAHRANIFTRSFNTNNIAESQFMVIKDRILQRVKEYNAVSLFEKLTDDLNEHSTNKLPSVASGSFDNFSSTRYKGKTKRQNETVGFKIPEKKHLQLMEKGIKSLGKNIYNVPSETVPNLSYVVDTSMGVCECKIGSAGAPCKHQFILWSTQKVASPNFLPCFSEEDRQKFACIAIGETLSLLV